MRVRLLSLLIITSMVATEPAVAAALATWPERPIRLIIPFPPGGSNDIVGRVIATKLSERLGKSVVVDNRGGAGGAIGTEIAFTAVPDGYTLLLISVANAYGPSLQKH